MNPAEIEPQDVPRRSVPVQAPPAGAPAERVSATAAVPTAGQLLAAQREVLRTLAAGGELGVVLAALCRSLEGLLSDATCSILLCDETGKRFVHGAAPSLPPAYVAAIDAMGGGPAAATGWLGVRRHEVAVAADIATDPLWSAQKDLALAHGLRACWSVPIRDRARGQPVGAVVVYHRRPRQPTAGEVDAVAGFEDLARLVIREARARAAVADAEGRYRTLVEQVPAVVFIERLDEHPGLTLSAQVTALLGYPPEALAVGHPRWIDLVHPDDRSRVAAAACAAAASGNAYDEEYRLIARSGQTVWVRHQAVLVRDEDGVPRSWHGVIIDLTPRRLAEEQVAYLAHHDALTGLPNRTLFTERLAAAIRRAEEGPGTVAVLFVDLDGFKNLNDGLGHATGDRLLVEVGTRLRRQLRPADTIARFGGDEFVILLEDVPGGGEAAAVADRLLAALRPPWIVDGCVTQFGGSIGVTVMEGEGAEPEELLRQADIALYEAKAAGRGTKVVYALAMSLPVAARHQWEADLRQALPRGELVLHFQPEIDLATGRIARLEALVRWRHPEHGLLQPANFVRLAEETGLIVPLGRWVLREACRRTRDWQGAGAEPPVGVSVNLSTREFCQLSLVDDVTRILADTGLAPGALELHITETTAAVAAKQTVTRLRQLGVRVAIDDFGKSYPSLNVLHGLEVDVLKIDRSFVAGLGRDRRSNAVVRAIAALGHDANLVVTAKGIETTGQVDIVRRLGIDFGQGFALAPPMGAEAIDALLARHPLTAVTRGVGAGGEGGASPAADRLPAGSA